MSLAFTGDILVPVEYDVSSVEFELRAIIEEHWPGSDADVSVRATGYTIEVWNDLVGPS